MRSASTMLSPTAVGGWAGGRGSSKIRGLQVRQTDLSSIISLDFPAERPAKFSADGETFGHGQEKYREDAGDAGRRAVCQIQGAGAGAGLGDACPIDGGG